MKFGDENTSLFQAMDTYSFRRNFISQLTLHDGTILTNHDQIAGALWLSYKDRLGTSEFIGISYGLASLIHQIVLPELDSPFTVEEIEAIVKDMPSSHAPGPDGFNGLFIKRCWPLIKQDFLRLCRNFVEGNLDLSSINGSLITLIPKKDNPKTIIDYRPISLLNYSIKLLTKLLANRLQVVILQVVHTNQYGFIKGRSIQDCLAWAFQFLHICHQSKKEIIILKLDFERAFDKVEHQVILDMLHHKGFSSRWIQWVKLILQSGSSSVLINGVPGKSFTCKRGGQTGGSPLLFVLATDLLQSIVNEAFARNAIKHPLGLILEVITPL